MFCLSVCIETAMGFLKVCASRQQCVLSKGVYTGQKCVPFKHVYTGEHQTLLCTALDFAHILSQKGAGLVH